MKNKPIIYCFSNIKTGTEGLAYAMAEDGTVLGMHHCLNEEHVSADLGVTPGTGEKRHEVYKCFYPNGYTMEFVRAIKVREHLGLMKAIRKNIQAGKDHKAAARNK